MRGEGSPAGYLTWRLWGTRILCLDDRRGWIEAMDLVVVMVHFRLRTLISTARLRASFDKSITTIRGISWKINVLMISATPSNDHQFRETIFFANRHDIMHTGFAASYFFLFFRHIWRYFYFIFLFFCCGYATSVV